MAISNETVDSFKALLESSRSKRSEVADLIKAGQWLRAEEDDKRGNAFDLRMLRTGAESVRGQTLDFLPTPFLEQGALVSRAIGKVVVRYGGATEEGSGVLVAPGVLLTNQHVIRDADNAGMAAVDFDFEDDRRPNRRVVTSFAIDPAQGFVASAEVGGLDYALVAVGRRLAGPASLDDLPTCPLLDTGDRHRLGMPVNIIQHPGGRQRVVALRENRLLYRGDRALLYETDTERGSSGAGVFNDQWDLVALHHYGEPMLAAAEGVTLSKAALNEGIRISVIVADLKLQQEQARQQGRMEQVALIERVLQHAAAVGEAPPSKRLQKAPAGTAAESFSTTQAPTIQEGKSMRELQFSIPDGVTRLKIDLRFEPAAGPAVAALPASNAPTVARLVGAAPATGPALTPAAEGNRIDRDYGNRGGFDESFLEGMPIDLQAIVDKKKSKIAPLVDGDGSILRYQHFSVVMHRTRRLAMLTATNIDGPTYLSIDRKTGEITPLAAEGETWYTDPRIANEYLVTQEWYSGWSHLFDRGHLTRRKDPTWGDADSALRAEKDTFHFSNCTPQHWRFNESAKHWQGLERYVLEFGVFKTQARLSVLQGPIFGAYDDLGDDLQIPSRFWKLVAWRGRDGSPRALAFVASQQELFGEERGGRLPANDRPPQVGEFQITISELCKSTGLDFSALEPWDTFGEQVTAGEAQRPVRDWSQLRIGEPPA